MSLEQHPSKANDIHVDNMPPIDKTVIPPKEHRDDKLEKKSFMQRHKKKIAAVAVGNLLAGGAAFMYVKKNFTDPLEEALNNPNNPSVSGPVEPGVTNPDTEANVYTPKAPTLEAPQMESGRMLYEQAWENAPLTAEQKAIWESGSPEQRQALAEDVVGTKIGYALFDLSRAGSDADVSYVTMDQVAKDELNHIVSRFSEIDPNGETPALFSLCSATFEEDNPPRCNPANFAKAPNLIPEDGEQMTLVAIRHTFDDQWADNEYNARVFEAPLQIVLDPNDRLTVVSQ